MAEHYLGPGSSGYTPPQALRALGERWQAVARYEQQAQLEQARRQATAFDWADAQDVNQHQSGLFDFGDSHAASTQEPALVKAEPWSIKERLTAEKSALGFYLSGHLFEEYAPEVR